MPFNKETTIVELTGGLGNQLFQYFAGMSLSNSREIKYQLVDRNTKCSSPIIYSLGLPLNLIEKSIKPRRNARVLSRAFRYALRKNGVLRFLTLKLFRVYQSEEVGYDFNFQHIAKYRRIIGYFQSYRYIPELIHLEGFILNKPTNKIIELMDEVEKVDPTAIHIRGGDYANLRESFGMLSHKYYANALAEINKLSPEKPIWVFTNDLELTQKILHELDLPVTKIFSENDLDTIETMILMSHSQRIVISNSTFSWWAAYLRGLNKIVVAPATWFKSMEDPIDLIPLTWIKVESTWLD